MQSIRLFEIGRAICTPSILTWAFLVIYLLHVNYSLKRYWDEKLIYYDIISYYAYLPSAFIYHDLTLKYIDKDPTFFRDRVWPETTPEGKRVIKTSMGLSLLYAPFFLAGQVATILTAHPSDGYSYHYRLFLVLSCLFYVSLGILALRSILLRFYSEWITAIVLALILLGTNLFHYASYEPLMSHAYTFSMVCIYVWIIIRWFERPSLRLAVGVGLFAGIIALIRPVNLLFAIIFILYDVRSWRDLLSRPRFFLLQHPLHIGAIILSAFLIGLPQFLYWKYATGHWLFYSYQGERFFFTHPHLLDGLFGFRKGWLIYTPIMAFAIAGLFFLRRFAAPFALAISVFFVLNVYILLSWWSWWYGGGYGLRAFIDMYGLMAIAMGACLTWLFSQTWWVKSMTGVSLAFLLYLSHYQNRQYRAAFIHWDSMTFKAYKAVFMSDPPPNYNDLLSPPDYEAAKKYGREPNK